MSMNVTELAYLPVHEIVRAMNVASIGPAQLMEAYLERIDRHDGRLHAFVDVYRDDALKAAHAAQSAIDSGHRISPFHGIPVAVKDIIDIEGRITTGGSLAWANRRSPITATLVQRMISVGMIVLGKTHSVEFAMGGWGTNQRMGTPWNPWDLETHRTPGGSSSGTGVAVAAGMAPWGIGTDTGGSVRMPAGWCNLVGLKTTVGRISTHGVLPLSHTLDTPGPLARSVEDAALLFGLLHGPDKHDEKTRGYDPVDALSGLKRGIAGRRFAVMPAVEREGVDSDILTCFDASLEVLRSLGASLTVLERLPRTFEDFAALTGRIIFAEGYSHVGDLCDDPTAPLDEDVRPRILAGKHTSARDYIDALRERQGVQQAFADALRGYDALLTPTMLTPALPLEDVDQKGTPAGFTRVVNYLDRCALTVPNGFTSEGLPSGLQIVCAPFDEANALSYGWAYEASQTWHERHPPGLD
ncbi:MAG: aspartyl-tRNA(Asn)/glutamyl-tRNA(Gln) amidotransferase subunit A [Gammaproteobacteria bacterium]|jgi:aspartyl-tRNA(Asn)/glutamyl-tRNA(Gln) amidotransferase subunit A